jgi:hypothetical protein
LPASVSAVAAVAGLLLATSAAPHVVLTLQDPAITESSGLSVSARHPGVLWTHNDGGTTAQVVAVNAHGDSVARVTLAGIDPYDPEALAPGVDERGAPALYLGDIGDNMRRRPDVSVFRFAEPAVLGDATVRATWYRFTYPDGSHDAEALLVGSTGRIMIATKGFSEAGLYLAPRKLLTADQGVNRLKRVAPVPMLVTDGAYVGGGRFVLRTYTSAYLYDRPGHEIARAELPPQPQGESVAADGKRLLIGSEGVHSQVLAVPVPSGLPPPTGTTSTAADPSPASSSNAPGDPAVQAGAGVRTTTWVFRVIGVLVLLAGIVVVVRRRR